MLSVAKFRVCCLLCINDLVDDLSSNGEKEIAKILKSLKMVFFLNNSVLSISVGKKSYMLN